MTRLMPLALAAALAASPALSQDSGGSNLIEEGADLLLRGLLEEVAPPLQELAGIGREVLPAFQLLAEQMGPAFAEVIGQVDSITYYEPPVIAPNGDIVLRRRADAPAWVAPEPEETAGEDAAPEAEAPKPEEPAPAEPKQDDAAPKKPRGFDLTPPPEGEPDLQLDRDGAMEL